MNNEIEKPEQPSHDDVLAAIQSFNDPSIIVNLFGELGWNYSVEIKETLVLAKQNANLSIKFKAIKHLRELLREAAETSGYIANVSTTAPNAHGGHTTFHAKRIAGILNPAKKIESTEIKETQDDESKETRTEPDRGSDRGQSQIKESVDEQHLARANSPESIRDSRCAFPIGDAESGGTEPKDGGETPERPRIRSSGDNDCNTSDSDSPDNPCIKTRPPTCDRDLFRGISSAE